MDLSDPASKKPESDGPEIEITGLANAPDAGGNAPDAGGNAPDAGGNAPDAGGGEGPSALGATLVASNAERTEERAGTPDSPANQGATNDRELNDLSGIPGGNATIVGPLDPEGGATKPWAPSTVFLLVSAAIVAGLDLASKEWAKQVLAGPDLKRSLKRFEAIPDHLDFIFAQNPGGAWSFLRNMPDGLRRPFFLFVSSAAIVFIVSVYKRLEKRQWAMRWGLPLALGGAIGNLSDRIRYGWVVDFIDFYWNGSANDVHWPTFNVADVAIVAGVGLMAIDLVSLRRAERAAAEAQKTAESTPA